MEMNSLERIPIRRDGDVIYEIVLRDSFDGLGEDIAHDRTLDAQVHDGAQIIPVGQGLGELRI